jgi:arsenite methyltransferase
MTVNKDSYYQDHWLEIEANRLDRYELMFEWRPEHAAMLDPADIQPGHRVVDFGCGPGFLSLALADLVGDSGHVYGLDINSEFIRRSMVRAEENNRQDKVTFLQLTEHTMPLENASVDRVICKNVLEYVPDLETTLRELKRILRKDGKILVIDSDWGFVVVEPWSADEVKRFFGAASAAFREANIGRKLPAALKRAGFQNIEVAIRPFIDRQGSGMAVLNNMTGYIRTFSTMDPAELKTMWEELEQAVSTGDYMFILPQFSVTATQLD